MALPTQQHRSVSIGTPLGPDVLLLKSMSGVEQLGRLFQFNLMLLSTDWSIKFDDIVGKNVTIRLETSTGEGTRYFNGFINRFRQESIDAEICSYSATMVPWLWFLTRVSDCRIFQEKAVPEIIKQVLQDYGFSDIKLSLTRSYRTWDYCVQYRETAFNFISRLMEQEGIYYFFEHENGKHTLVLADGVSAHKPCPGYESIDYRPQSTGIVSGEYITDWNIEKQVLSGAFVHRDFDFKKPQNVMESASMIAREHAMADFEIYDYPGEYVEPGEGDGYAKVRMEELQAGHELVRGATEARGFYAGGTFALARYPREDQNREYLLLSVQHQIVSDTFGSGSGGGAPLYSCDFRVMPKENIFRTTRSTPKPQIAGPQTAMVTGPSGEEIYTDEHGRVKVQFHWDRDGQYDEGSSCWVRVSQGWAGKQWGAIYLPRIGQEVIVEFLEGDPDRPIITGRVYNGVAKPPYDLPAEKTKSTLKSNSSKGGQGFNEIRFEDKKDDEQIFVHAEKDVDFRTKHDYRDTTLGHRDIRIGSEDGPDGKRGHQYTWVLEDVDTIYEANHHELIKKDEHRIVKGDVNEKFEKSQKTFVTKGIDINSQYLIVETKDKISHKSTQIMLQGSSGVHIKGQQINLEGTSISLKSGGNFVCVNPGGVQIKGNMVLINSGGSPMSAQSAASTTAPNMVEPEEAVEADDDKSGDPTKANKQEKVKRDEASPDSTEVDGYSSIPDKASKLVDVVSNKAPEYTAPMTEEEKEALAKKVQAPTQPKPKEPCCIRTLRVHDSESKGDRKPGPNHILQIVPEPPESKDFKRKFGLITLVGTMKWGGDDELIAKVTAKVGEGEKKETALSEGRSPPPDSEWKAGGEYKHPISSWDNNKLWTYIPGASIRADGKTYYAWGRTCKHSSHKYTIEVFPNQQYKAELELKSLEEGFKLFNKTADYFNKLVGGLCNVVLIPPAGTFSMEWGWREDKDWRAYYLIAIEADLKPIIGVKAEMKATFTQLAATSIGIPPALSKFAKKFTLADLYLKFEASVQVKVKGQKRYQLYSRGDTLSMEEAIQLGVEASGLLEGAVEVGSDLIKAAGFCKAKAGAKAEVKFVAEGALYVRASGSKSGVEINYSAELKPVELTVFVETSAFTLLGFKLIGEKSFEKPVWTISKGKKFIPSDEDDGKVILIQND